jgi:hypothetical protein
MKAKLRIACAIAGLAAVGGCNTMQIVPADRAFMDVDQVIALTDEICGATKPGFQDAESRMLANGLTIEQQGRLHSSTYIVSADIGELDDGSKVCSLRASYDGDVMALQAELRQRLGPSRSLSSLRAPAVLYFDRGPNGKMLLLIQPKVRGRNTIYDLGYADAV